LRARHFLFSLTVQTSAPAHAVSFEMDKRESNPCTGLERPSGLQEFEAYRFYEIGTRKW
jgi:hypothetical protein